MQTTARITIKRLPRPYGDLFRAYGILIDDAHVGSVKRRKTRSIEVAPGHHRVRLTIDFCASPEVEVDLGAGEEAHFECRAASFNAGTAMLNGFARYIELKLVSVLPSSLGEADVSVTSAAPPPPPTSQQEEIAR
jgi:hypothetical protein